MKSFAAALLLFIACSPISAASLHVVGDPLRPTIVQASGDLQNWSNIQTNPPGARFPIADGTSRSFDRRFYRVVNGATSTIPDVVPIPADDLAALPNKVFMAGEGFNAVQFSSSGTAAFVVWKNQDLIYRERNSQGGWGQQVVCSLGGGFQVKEYDEHRFQPAAVLFFDSGNKPHVFVAQSQKALHFEFNGTWFKREEIGLPANNPVCFVGAVGSGDKFHLAMAGADPHAIYYGNNRNGGWNWTRAVSLNGHPRGFYHQSYAPRFISLAVDSKNMAHLVYSPAFQMLGGPGGYPRLLSELNYASNQDGQWRAERIATVPDGSGDSGLGSSIAIGADDRPAIASWYDERADTGSSQESRLMYHRKLSTGKWETSKVTEKADQYIAGDGNKGTGFAPYLRFDGAGRPHIVFQDHAAEHFGNSGQMEYAGQIRHCFWNGSQWVFRTVVSQGSPLLKQMIYPSFAVSGNEVVGIALQRETIWGPDTWPRTIDSTYRLLNFQFNF